MTDPDLERRAMALFDEMLDVADGDRDAWLGARTAGEPELRRRIEAMRAAEQQASLRTGGAALDGEVEAPVPDRLGGYRVLERIGRGGMGSVHRAERDRGDFEHVAAVKIIKPGLLSDRLVERFLSERQTLARLSHPNIAQLFDGGETEDGAPYIIMELIDGLPLLDWVDRHGAPLATRLELFGQACAAVAFAHGNLIVHRDITPSNILVTADGRAKLIDFGIARPVVQEEEGAAPPLSPTQSLSLTPGYAAPERMTGQAITTAADIYSLGKVLERLVGQPAPPELAAIVARATELRPQDRYPTVEALAEDVRRWREGRTVSAYRGGRFYPARKFVARHRFGVVAASLAAMLLVASLALTSWSYLRAEHARADAERRFEQTRAIAKALLFDAYDEVSKVPGATRARAALAGTGVRYLDTLAAQDDTPTDVRIEVGRGYTRLAQVTGGGESSELGRYKDADALLAQAERILAPLHRADPGDAAVARAYAELLVEQAGTSLYNNNAADRARALARRAQRIVEPQARTAIEAARTYAAAIHMEGDSFSWGDDYAHARDAYLRLDPFLASLPPAWRSDRALLSTRSVALRLLGEAHHKLKDEGAAVRALAEAVAINERLAAAAPDDPKVLRKLALSLWYQGVVLRTLKQDVPARRSVARALQLARMLQQRDPHDAGALHLYTTVAEVQAQVLADQRRYPESYALLDDVIAGQRRVVTGAEDAPGALRSLAAILRTGGGNHYNGGDFAGACRLWEEALSIWQRLDARGAVAAADRRGDYGEMKDYIARACRNGPPRSLGEDEV